MFRKFDTRERKSRARLSSQQEMGGLIPRYGAQMSLLATCIATTLALPGAHATDGESWGTMTSEELRSFLSGHTLTGRHEDGMPYSEWHAPDGRVYGHNNHRPVDRGCWDIRRNLVCYYYGNVPQGTEPRVSCWAFRRVTEAGVRLKLVNKPPAVEASGLRQTGNPYQHSNNGKPWTCDPLMSRQKRPPSLAMLEGRML